MKPSHRRRALALLATSALLSAPAAAWAQDAETIAHQRFLEGMRHYDAHRYEPALEEFRASYGLYASPNSRLYVARALRDEGRLAEAATEYETTVSESDARAQSDTRYLATRDAARDELAALAPHIGRLALTVPNAPRWVRVRVNGRVTPRGELGLALPITPGAVEVVVDADGYPVERRTLTVAPGERASLEITLQGPAVPPANPPTHAAPSADDRGGAHARPVLDGEWMLHGRGAARPLAYTALALGVAGFAGFAGFGAWAGGTYAHLDGVCVPAPCPGSQRAAVDMGRTLQVVTNVSLGVGIGGIVTGVVLLLVGPRLEPAAATVRVAVGPGSLAFGAAF